MATKPKRSGWTLFSLGLGYLIDQGGVDRQYLSAVGYADTRPVASNESEEGRSANRRIEIVLHPKDLSIITGQLASQ